MSIAIPIACLAASALFAVGAQAERSVKVEKVSYGGWPNCVKLTNGEVELIATTDVGPRIIRFGFVGQDNELYEDPQTVGKTGGDEWRLYGGHRLWLAPEAKPRSYYPDNHPIKFEIRGNTVRLLPETESTTGMQKEMQVTVDPNANHVELIHKITNHNLWAVELAPWALTVMNQEGRAIVPQEPYSPHPDMPDEPGQKIDSKYYLPVRTMVLWSYTNLADPRWTFTPGYIVLRQDPKAKRPQKLGISSEQNWLAYGRKGHLFVKKAAYQPGATYPDGGCVFEVFTNWDILEMESLGPLVTLAPGASVTHKEDWYLFSGVEFENTDASIDANVMPKVKACLKP